MATLIAYAVAREGEAVVGKHPHTLELGVGKIAATLSLTLALAQHKPDAVLLVGVCGAYPDRHLRAGLPALNVGDLCLVTSEVIVDAGVLTPDGFMDLAQLHLGEIGPISSDAELTGRLGAVLDCPLVTGATVSTGAGADPLSQAYGLRSGAQVETMEGAAVAMVCRHFGVRFAQLRAVSNRTGDRNDAVWDLDGSLARLGTAVERVLAAGVLP
ncbi:MAG: futalosine hydrolase [Enhygromyxa sp.]